LPLDIKDEYKSQTSIIRVGSSTPKCGPQLLNLGNQN